MILEDLSADALAAMQAEGIALKILHAVSQQYLLDLTVREGLKNTRSYHCTSSIGITLFRDNSLSADELMKRADTAMYQAKAGGRNALRFFDPEMHAAVAARAMLDNDLREAVRQGQFRHMDFVNQVLAIVDSSGVNPKKLKLELTESLLLEDAENIISKMTALKAKGIGFSLDDFGTGYSSLSYLKRLPLDQLKIDQSFARDVLTDPNDAAIARTIVALAQSMGLSVIAEGVETEAQREFLAANYCTAYQGYLFGRPMPVDLLSPRS